MSTTDNIPKDLAKRLFDDQAIIVVKPIADYRHCLYQSELELVRDVSEKRLLEFSTGRDCAHQAMHKMGYEICPILKGKQREPIWPNHVVGSISHCRDLAGAVVTDKSQICSVGFDIENRRELNPEIARHICTSEENDWLSKQNHYQRNLALLLIFSIKEAVFKCVHQLTNYSLGFQECQITHSIYEEEAGAVIATPYLNLKNTQLHPRFYINETHLYSGAMLLPR